jgi:hypothetical protein
MKDFNSMYFVLEIFNVRYANYHDYDVTFHKEKISRSWDSVHCIIIKPFICVLSTYTTNICYVLSNLNQLRIKVINVFSENHAMVSN